MTLNITEHLKVTRTFSWELDDERLKEFYSYSPDLEGMSWEEIMKKKDEDFCVKVGEKDVYLEDLLTTYYCENFFDEDAKVTDEDTEYDYDDGFYTEN